MWCRGENFLAVSCFILKKLNEGYVCLWPAHTKSFAAVSLLSALTIYLSAICVFEDIFLVFFWSQVLPSITSFGTGSTLL